MHPQATQVCAHCGKPQPGDSQFCDQCGKPRAAPSSGLTDYTRKRQLFDAALTIDPSQRDTWLWSACQFDTTLFQEMREMLQASQKDTFLATPAVAPPSIAPPSQQQTSGPYIGAYKLLRELGRGGMGVVYLAVRDDGAFRKHVAVKLLLRENVTPEFVARFKQERQVLAALDHPNIARILDGGDAPDGMPYYVMEYVEGKPVDSYCDDQRLSLTNRIKVFQQMCEAVQYLHQNSILHRDLKPGNILVSSAGLVKLLDFGIAKVVGAGSFANPNLTGVGGSLMTPNYASPEQINGAPLQAGSDIYSLGVILYGLLTGRAPFTGFEDKMAKMATRQDPPLPSANIRADLNVTESTAKLRRAMLGELDSIVLKTMKYDPQDRYSSAMELSTDLQRFLDGQPVAAHRETLTRRSMRVFRRVRMAVAVGVAFLVLGGFGLWQWRRVEGQKAELAAREAQLRSVLEDLEKQVDTVVPADDGKPSPTAMATRIEDVKKLKKIFASDYAAVAAQSGKKPEVFVERAVKYLDRVQAGGGNAPDLTIEVADAYQQLGALQESANPPNKAAAMATYRKAAVLLEGCPDQGKVQDRLARVRGRIQTLGGGKVEEAVAPPPPVSKEAEVPAAKTPVVASRGTTPPAVAVVKEAPYVPAPPPPPEELPKRPTVSPAEVAALHDDYASAESRIQIAEATLAPIKANLERQGQTLNAGTMAAMAKMKARLAQGQREMAAGNLAAAKESFGIAKVWADAVLKSVGR